MTLAVVTCMMISAVDGILRTSVSCADPAFSLKLYDDWLNATTLLDGTVTVVVAIYITKSNLFFFQ